MPEGVKLLQGKWWQKSDADGLAVVDHVARRLNLHPGSSVDFESGEKTIHTQVAAIYKPEGEHVFARSEFILPSGSLQGLPNVWYAAVHVQSKQIPFMERALFAAYPTVTVINIADILDTVQGVVHQITLVIRFLAAFSIFSGAIILASSVASTRFRRIREVVVLKTLGATRNRIAAVFSIEFVVLGLLAGVGWRDLRKPAVACVAAQDGGSIPSRVDGERNFRSCHGCACSRDGMDCQLSDSWAEASGSAARGVRAPIA